MLPARLLGSTTSKLYVPGCRLAESEPSPRAATQLKDPVPCWMKMPGEPRATAGLRGSKIHSRKLSVVAGVATLDGTAGVASPPGAEGLPGSGRTVSGFFAAEFMGGMPWPSESTPKQVRTMVATATAMFLLFKTAP